MKKVIYLTLSLLIIFFVFIGYLSLIGIETKRFNNQIDLKAKEFNKELNIFYVFPIPFIKRLQEL